MKTSDLLSRIALLLTGSKPPGIKHTRSYRHKEILKHLKKTDPSLQGFDSLSERAWAIANSQEYND